MRVRIVMKSLLVFNLLMKSRITYPIILFKSRA